MLSVFLLNPEITYVRPTTGTRIKETLMRLGTLPSAYYQLSSLLFYSDYLYRGFRLLLADCGCSLINSLIRFRTERLSIPISFEL
jgi:hypothetical protein